MNTRGLSFDNLFLTLFWHALQFTRVQWRNPRIPLINVGIQKQNVKSLQTEIRPAICDDLQIYAHKHPVTFQKTKV
jgi:hypothetical protein